MRTSYDKTQALQLIDDKSLDTMRPVIAVFELSRFSNDLPDVAAIQRATPKGPNFTPIVRLLSSKLPQYEV